MYLETADSTNEVLREMIRKEKFPEGFVVHTDFQTAGKGQIGNSWESESGKNILFSLVLFPQKIRPDQQFLISQLVSLGIKNTLDEFTDGITVKWPNDIYWNNKKIAGILIENSLQGKQIKFTVVGVGLNVNQTEFVASAPNPVSLRQIIGKRIERIPLLEKMCWNIMYLYLNLDVEKLQTEYSAMLFRKDGFHTFKADGELFEAKIFAVYPDGRLELETADGEYRSFYFKEVSFVL